MRCSIPTDRIVFSSDSHRQEEPTGHCHYVWQPGFWQINLLLDQAEASGLRTGQSRHLKDRKCHLLVPDQHAYFEGL